MKIVTWNVNSIRARLPNVLAFLQKHQPNIVLLQELKCEESVFPESLQDLGYNAAIFGQKTYNGVAILSKHPIEDVQKGLPNFDDTQARYIEAFTGGLRISSIYVPNGQAIDAPAYTYKIQFMDALFNHVQTLKKQEEILVLGGDFNIAPTDADVHDAKAWHEQILCSSRERDAFFRLIFSGLTDAVYDSNRGKQVPYTWWDYRKGAYVKGDGLRIDHLLLSSQAADCLISTMVHKDERGKEKASDHAPVECVLA